MNMRYTLEFLFSTMPRVLKFLFILLIGSFASCADDAKPLYEVRLDADFVISSSLPVSNVLRHYAIVRDVPVFFLEYANQKNIDTSLIKVAYPSYGSIKTIFGDSDLSFIEDVIVNIVPKSGPKLEIYRIDFVNYNTGNEIRMLSQTFDGMKKHLQNEFIDLEIGFRLRQFPPRDVRARLDFGYVVYD